MQMDLRDAPVAAAGLTPDEARLRLAMSLYRDARLSTKLRAEMAGLDRRAFMDELARHRVEAPYDLEDLQSDLAALDKLAGR